MSRDWFAEWLACESGETLAEYIERCEANDKAREAVNPYALQMLAQMQNSQPQYGTALSNLPLGGMVGGLGNALGGMFDK